MSFRQTPSATSIWNRALGKIAESTPIVSEDDPDQAAEACRRWYKSVVAKLLEMHHWGLATKFDSLVAISNNRSSEWLYAYALPDDCAFPVRLNTLSGVSNVSYYRGLGSLLAMVNGRPAFEMKNAVLYTAYAGSLEYVSFDITEADFNATFENLVILGLAAQLALEIPKDRKLHDALKDELTTELNLAITQNLNIGNSKYGLGPSEAELARGSGLRNWDWFPMSPGEAVL